MNKNILLSTILTSMLFSAGGASSETIGRSIATVNGEAIFLQEYQSNLSSLLEQQKEEAGNRPLPEGWEAEAKKALLDQMIDEKILLQEARRRNERVPKRQVEEGIKQVKNRFKILAPGARPTKEDYERELTPQELVEFRKELKTQGISEKEFEAKIEDQLKVLRLTENEVRSHVPEPFVRGADDKEEPQTLTPQYEKEAKALYGEIEKKYNQANFKPNPEEDVDVMVATLKSRLGEMVRASNILIKSSRTDDMKKRKSALDKAKAIKADIDKGADFFELAETKSDSPGAKEGGDLGFFTRGQMIPEIEKAAFAMSVGGVSDVIESEFGYHLIKVTERRAARRLRYDDIKVDLANVIYQRRSRERFEEFVGELRKKADIKVTMDLSAVVVEKDKK
jgi:peptidyl-prolyl cis-trans isomerase C